MNQKGFANIIIVIVIVVLVGAVAHFALRRPAPVAQESTPSPFQSQVTTPSPNQITSPNQTPDPVPTPSADQITDWKTYRNEEFGYELKYPVDWYITQPIVNPLEILSFKADQKETRQLGIPKKEISVGIYINKNMPYQTVIEWADQKKVFSQREEIMVAGEKALRGRMSVIGLNNTVGIDKGFAGAILIHNNIGYEIIYYPYNSTRINTYNKILPTFKFLR